MTVHFGARRVRTPAGDEWRVGRRWANRPAPRWRRLHPRWLRGGYAAEALLQGPADLDEFGLALLVLTAIVALVLVVIPLLLFGIELIALGLLIALGIVGRALLRRPWIVRAEPLELTAPALSWQVIGWRRANRLIDEVAASLSGGIDPAPAEADGPLERRQAEIPHRA